MREARLMKKTYGVLLVDEEGGIKVYIIRGKALNPVFKITEAGIESVVNTFTKPSFGMATKEVKL